MVLKVYLISCISTKEVYLKQNSSVLKELYKKEGEITQVSIKLCSAQQVLNICYVIIIAVIKEGLLSTLNFLNSSSLTL